MITSRNYIKLDEKVNSITSIPPRAKILHGEICALSQTDGFCFASNKYFARRLNLSIQSVSRLIGVLKHYKLITVSRIIDDNGYRKRIIKPNSSITLSKISVGNAQKREKHTLKNANYNTVMISKCGAVFFLFGNKMDEKGLTNASGVKKEFEIAVKNEKYVFPIGATGYMAKELADIVLSDFEKYNGKMPKVKKILKKLNNSNTSPEEIIDGVLHIIDAIAFRPECQ